MGFSHLALQTANINVLFDNYWIISPQGKGLFAKKPFKKGDTIFIEKPLVSSQFLWNALYKYRGESIDSDHSYSSWSYLCDKRHLKICYLFMRHFETLGCQNYFKSLGWVRFMFFFLKKCLLRIKAAVIWSKLQKNNSKIMKYYCDLK